MSNLLLLFDGIHLEGGVPMALFYAAFGFVFVFVGLTLLVVIFTLLGKLMSTVNESRTKQASAPAEQKLPAESSDEEISPETVAVISAAIAAYLGEGEKCDFVVRRIKRI